MCVKIYTLYTYVQSARLERLHLHPTQVHALIGRLRHIYVPKTYRKTELYAHLYTHKKATHTETFTSQRLLRKIPASADVRTSVCFFWYCKLVILCAMLYVLHLVCMRTESINYRSFNLLESASLEFCIFIHTQMHALIGRLRDMYPRLYRKTKLAFFCFGALSSGCTHIKILARMALWSEQLL